MARALEIVETQEDGACVLALVGRLDTNTSSQLDVVANRIYKANRAADIVMDMGECTYLSSAGLRVIIAMQKRTSTGGSLTFRNVGPNVMEVFDSTGFTSILVFE